MQLDGFSRIPRRVNGIFDDIVLMCEKAPTQSSFSFSVERLSLGTGLGWVGSENTAVEPVSG